MKNKVEKRYFENNIFYAIIIVFCFFLLYFCSASSFRYAVNPWNDANAFFTVGKAMFNGFVPYRDIFEQKGPLLYFFHGIAYLISNDSFVGVYVLEALNLFAFSVLVYKSSVLVVGNRPLSCIVSVLTSFFVVNSFSFYYGDSAEEFVLPMFMFGLYYALKYFKDSENERISWYIFLICGYFAGSAAMIKFTLIGFWFGWMAVFGIHTLFLRKEVTNAFKFSFIFLAGMALAILPWIIYFRVNDSLKDFFNVYVVINSSSYGTDNNFIVKVLDIIYQYRTRFAQFPLVVAVSTVSCLPPLFFKKFSDGKFFSRIVIPFLYGMTMFFIYYGGKNYTYYFLPLTIFSCYLLILFFSFLPEFKNKKLLLNIVSLIVSIGIVFVSALTNPISINTLKKGEVTYQSLIADYIDTHNPDGKILNYNCLDLGVYLHNNYIELFKYFEKQNIEYEKFSENLDEQNRYIDEHEADYVITLCSTNDAEEIFSNNKTLKDDYETVLCIPFEWIFQGDLSQNKHYYCFLFELKQS